MRLEISPLISGLRRRWHSNDCWQIPRSVGDLNDIYAVLLWPIPGDVIPGGPNSQVVAQLRLRGGGFYLLEYVMAKEACSKKAYNRLDE
jgi:hypothetical protein